MAHKRVWIDSRWFLPLLLAVALLAVGWILILKPTAPAGCFTFRDGTVRGWTLDQLYDSNANPPRRIKSHVSGNPGSNVLYTPFQLSNYRTGALQAEATSILITDKSVKSADIYLNSPDLSRNKSWQGVEGVGIDIPRTLTMICRSPVPPFRFTAQLQVVVTDKATATRHVVAQVDGSGKFLFHTIPNTGKQHIQWKWGKTLRLGGKDRPLAALTIEKLRVRLTMPGTPEVVECMYGGAWRLADICPVR